MSSNVFPVRGESDLVWVRLHTVTSYYLIIALYLHQLSLGMCLSFVISSHIKDDAFLLSKCVVHGMVSRTSSTVYWLFKLDVLCSYNIST